MTIFLVITVFIAGAGFGFLLYSVITYYFTRVPHVATPSKRFDPIFDELESLLEKKVDQASFIDFGSGFGSVLFEAKNRGYQKVTGYELSPWHFFVSKMMASLKNIEVNIKRGDFFNADITEADVLYLFLTRQVVDKMEAKIKTEAKEGALVIVLGDEFRNSEPISTLHLTEKGKIQAYFYSF